MDKQTVASLQKIMDYLYRNEQKDWEENGKPVKGHIFHDVSRVAFWLEDEKDGSHTPAILEEIYEGSQREADDEAHDLAQNS